MCRLTALACAANDCVRTLIVCSDDMLVVHQRHLTVDDDMFVLRKENHEIRKQSLSVLPLEGLLCFVVLSFAAPLTQAFALIGLPPVSDQFFIAFKRLGKVARLRGHHLTHIV